jgi:hypothetical protein
MLRSGEIGKRMAGLDQIAEGQKNYAEAIAQYRAFVDGANGNQPGDPKLLAARIVTLASQTEVPSRLVLGDDARQWPARRSINCGRRSPSPPIAADTTDQGAGKGGDCSAPAVALGRLPERRRDRRKCLPS